MWCWGRVKKIHVRDDLYLSRGRIDVGALGVFGRLAAEYTVVDNIFTTPLPEELVDELSTQRAGRLDWALNRLLTHRHRRMVTFGRHEGGGVMAHWVHVEYPETVATMILSIRRSDNRGESVEPAAAAQGVCHRADPAIGTRSASRRQHPDVVANHLDAGHGTTRRRAGRSTPHRNANSRSR